MDRTARLLLGLLVMATPLISHAQQYTSYVAQLNGKNQVPKKVQSAATGVLTLNVDLVKQIGYYTFRMDKVNNYTMSHIHQGSNRTNGPPIVLLWPGLPSGSSSNLTELPMENPAIDYVESMVFRGKVTPLSLVNVVPGSKPLAWGAFLSKLAAGNTYVNIHTSAKPAGEIRGQLLAKGMTSKKWAA